MAHFHESLALSCCIFLFYKLASEQQETVTFCADLSDRQQTKLNILAPPYWGKVRRICGPE